MRKLTAALVMLWLVILQPTAMYAIGNTVIISASGAPSGTCGPIQLYMDSATGNLYDCPAGSWVQAGSGSASSGVTAAGTLTSTALVTGGGTKTVQTPSATSTLDTSGNLIAAGFARSTQMRVITADVTCGTGGTLAPCTAFTTITGLSATLPLVAQTWSFDCNLIVSQATAAAADQIGIQTATNGATNMMASAQAYTAAAVVADASLTGVASTTTAQSVITFTPSATGFKVPVHLSGTLETVSASGTVFNVVVLTGAAADLLTIYRGSSCQLY